MSTLPRSWDWACIIMRSDQPPAERKKELDRISQIIQNAIFRVQISSDTKGSAIRISIYNLDDIITGRLLWTHVHDLISSTGRCYVEIYNYVEGNHDEILDTECYLINKARLEFVRDYVPHKDAESRQTFTLEGFIEQELD